MLWVFKAWCPVPSVQEQKSMVRLEEEEHQQMQRWAQPKLVGQQLQRRRGMRSERLSGVPIDGRTHQVAVLQALPPRRQQRMRRRQLGVALGHLMNFMSDASCSVYSTYSIDFYFFLLCVNVHAYQLFDEIAKDSHYKEKKSTAATMMYEHEKAR
ncbi:hypothetical protein PVAP13_3KG262210 [Panicum virgatum]|nr:hypothetical protein PVAP13_3KG262210 [Panicum virgatum]